MIKIYKKQEEVNYSPTDVFLHFTGNIFGIGCSAFNETAINRILELKHRDANKGFIVLFSSLEQAKGYKLPQLENRKIKNLLEEFYPGNLTAILKTEDSRFEKVWLNNKIGIRIPVSKTLRDFIEMIGNPIVSTSINVSGNPFCTDLEVLNKEFVDWFDWGLYNADEPAGKPLPSTVIDFTDDEQSEVKCIREGSIPFAEVSEKYILACR
jgi:L-threonylcarbamoyladenylate synthase